MAANDMDRGQLLAHARAEMGLQGADDNLEIRCPSCPFVAVNHAQFSVHALGHLQDCRAVSDHPPARRPAPFRRPSMGTCCKLVDWANFMAAWERYRVGSNVQPNSAVYKSNAFPKKCARSPHTPT